MNTIIKGDKKIGNKQLRNLVSAHNWSLIEALIGNPYRMKKDITVDEAIKCLFNSRRNKVARKKDAERTIKAIDTYVEKLKIISKIKTKEKVGRDE